MPASLKHAIAAGIGLLVTLLGLEWGGVVRASPATLLTLGDLRSPAVAGTGFAVMALVAAWSLGLTHLEGIVQRPPSPRSARSRGTIPRRLFPLS